MMDLIEKRSAQPYRHSDEAFAEEESGYKKPRCIFTRLFIPLPASPAGGRFIQSEDTD